jgi:hypothetical protein
LSIDIKEPDRSYSTAIPATQEVCCCSSWSSDEYQSDPTNNNYQKLSKVSKAVRNRNGPYDALSSCWAPYHQPRRRADSKGYYPQGLSDTDSTVSHRQLKSPASNHKRSSSSSSQRTIDSGKDSATNSPSLSSSCCTEPFYLHEPHMTSNDRVKKLFEKEKRSGAVITRRKEEFTLNAKNNTHLGDYYVISYYIKLVLL